MGQGLGGALSQDTQLGPEGSPYLITADLVVPAGITLDLKPGVVLKFSPGINLTVQGTLSAAGGQTAETMVSLVGAQEGAFWGKMDIQGGNVTLSRTFVVAGGILLRSGELKVSDSVIAGCEVGFTLMGGQAEVKACRVTKNKAGFDLASPSASLSLQSCDVSQNGYGLAVRAFGSARIKGNRIHANKINLANLSASALDASGNWWGAQTDAEIAALVMDSADDPRYGSVQVRPLYGETAQVLAPTPAPQPTAMPVLAQPQPTAVPVRAAAEPAEPALPEEELWNYGDPYKDMKGLPWEGPKAGAKKTAVTLGSMAAVAVAVLLLL
jgi:hypothetical protein